MPTPNTWQTSVSDLVTNFLQCLNTLVPSMQNARILDDKLMGFDDWGRICDNLYTIMVAEPIRESFPENEHLDFDLPMYNTEYETFEHFSLIQVNQKEATPEDSLTKDTLILNCFVNSDNSQVFDEVEIFKIDSDFQIIENSFKTIKTDNVSFSCLRYKNRQWELLDTIASNLD